MTQAQKPEQKTSRKTYIPALSASAALISLTVAGAWVYLEHPEWYNQYLPKTSEENIQDIDFEDENKYEAYLSPEPELVPLQQILTDISAEEVDEQKLNPTLVDPATQGQLPIWAETLSKQLFQMDAALSAVAARLDAVEKSPQTAPSIKINTAHAALGSLLQMSRAHYYAGGPQMQSLSDLRNLMTALEASDDMVKAIDDLIALTPVEGPVTAEELRFMVARVAASGAPIPVEPELPKQEEIKAEQSAAPEEHPFKTWVKLFLNKMVQIEKVAEPELMQQWREEIETLALYLSQGRYEKASAFFASAPALQTDMRLKFFGEKLTVYMQQRFQLDLLFRKYIQNSLEGVK